MTIASLGNILKIFGGGDPGPEAHQQTVREALLMTLARASSSDSNINPVEVSAVQRLIKEATGEDISAADVRIAASAEIFETTSLDSALAKLSHKLQPADRVLIASCLARVIKSDRHISELEADFFNKVAHALKISPAELVGLVPER